MVAFCGEYSQMRSKINVVFAGLLVEFVTAFDHHVAAGLTRQADVAVLGDVNGLSLGWFLCLAYRQILARHFSPLQARCFCINLRRAAFFLILIILQRAVGFVVAYFLSRDACCISAGRLTCVSVSQIAGFAIFFVLEFQTIAVTVADPGFRNTFLAAAEAGELIIAATDFARWRFVGTVGTVSGGIGWTYRLIQPTAYISPLHFSLNLKHSFPFAHKVSSDAQVTGMRFVFPAKNSQHPYLHNRTISSASRYPTSTADPVAQSSESPLHPASGS